MIHIAEYAHQGYQEDFDLKQQYTQRVRTTIYMNRKMSYTCFIRSIIGEDSR
jgi:hypothetical protein